MRYSLRKQMDGGGIKRNIEPATALPQKTYFVETFKNTRYL